MIIIVIFYLIPECRYCVSRHIFKGRFNSIPGIIAGIFKSNYLHAEQCVTLVRVVRQDHKSVFKMLLMSLFFSPNISYDENYLDDATFLISCITRNITQDYLSIQKWQVALVKSLKRSDLFCFACFLLLLVFCLFVCFVLFCCLSFLYRQSIWKPVLELSPL